MRDPRQDLISRTRNREILFIPSFGVFQRKLQRVLVLREHCEREKILLEGSDFYVQPPRSSGLDHSNGASRIAEIQFTAGRSYKSV